MGNISAEALANQLLECCLAERPWPEHLLDDLLACGGDRELFRIVVERLGDLFEPRLCTIYAELFSEVIAKRTGLHADHLTARYERVRRPRVFDRDPDSIENVFVLSRVTLGADMAVTASLLDFPELCFRNADTWFVGPAKNWALFSGDTTRRRHFPIAYGRGGTIDDRLSIWPQLREAVSLPNSIIIDPDSRLTQLGLLPICPEEDYYFFESRSYGGDGPDSLCTLTKRWTEEIFGADWAYPYLTTDVKAAEFACTVSFGVGENPAKRVADPFEGEILQLLPRPLLIDKGAGGEEAERVERAVARAGGEGITMWDGSFAGFAAHIQKSKLYVGYDSAGGHVAAACAVPMISIFAGAVCERMFQRWRPTGQGKIAILRPDNMSINQALATFEACLNSLS